MTPYHKIETLFVRDEKTFKVIEAHWRTPEFEYLKSNVWHGTEKLDGTNIRIHWTGSAIQYGGKTDNAQIPVPLLEAMRADIPSESLRRVFGESAATLYGEGLGPKIQNGGRYGDKPKLVLFDVFCGGLWLERANVDDIASNLGIDAARVLFFGELESACRFVKSGEVRSHYGDFVPEGLVLRPPHELFNRRGERIIGKIKTSDFAV